MKPSSTIPIERSRASWKRNKIGFVESAPRLQFKAPVSFAGKVDEIGGLTGG
jgi:hypothetical protein